MSFSLGTFKEHDDEPVEGVRKRTKPYPNHRIAVSEVEMWELQPWIGLPRTQHLWFPNLQPQPTTASLLSIQSGPKTEVRCSRDVAAVFTK